MAYYDFKTEGSGAKAYYLGTLAHGSTMNVAAKYADYANLTKDNFVIVPQSRSASGSSSMTHGVDLNVWWWLHIYDNNTATYNAPSISYNPLNGNLSFTSTVSCGGESHFTDYGGTTHYAHPSGSTGLRANVYLLPEIEDIS